jgi:hypothetical protein
MKKFICFSAILLSVLYGFSQSKQKIDTIFEYKPANAEFENILSDFILHEQNYDYYSSGITFTILFFVTDSETSFYITSGSEKSAKFCDTTIFSICNEDPDFIIIHYNNHYFYSICRTNQIDTNLVTRTGHFFKTNIIKKKKQNNEKKNEIDLTDAIDDDRYFETYWGYVFKENTFYEVGKSPRTYGRTW